MLSEDRGIKINHANTDYTDVHLDFFLCVPLWSQCLRGEKVWYNLIIQVFNPEQIQA